MKEVKAFKCDFCNKVSLNRLSHHEKFCKNNPVNKHACFDCENLIIKKEVIREGLDEFWGDITLKVFYCSAHDKNMHSYKAEKRKMEVVSRTERMPILCDEHKPVEFI